MSKPIDDMRPEYDFTGAERGKHHQAYSRGNNLVLLDADVAEVFTSTEAVNHALRMLIDLAHKEIKE